MGATGMSDASDKLIQASYSSPIITLAAFDTGTSSGVVLEMKADGVSFVELMGSADRRAPHLARPGSSSSATGPRIQSARISTSFTQNSTGRGKAQLVRACALTPLPARRNRNRQFAAFNRSKLLLASTSPVAAACSNRRMAPSRSTGTPSPFSSTNARLTIASTTPPSIALR